MAAQSEVPPAAIPTGRRWSITRSVLTCMSVAAALVLSTVNAQAADFPPNPTTKSGYTLDFQEEFDGTTLNTSKWLPSYLPHWTSTPANAQARYTVANGVLTERLDADTPAWNAQYDGTVKISSIQSYEKDWWHQFNASMPNNHHEPDFDGYSTKYGYFEIRAKLSNVGGGGHQAFWLVGTNGTGTGPAAQSEIDFIETFFSKPANWRIAAYGWGDPDFLSSWYLSDTTVPNGSPTSEYHVYGMDWTPTQLNFYYDNQLYKTINDAPNTAMAMILGIYTDAYPASTTTSGPRAGTSTTSACSRTTTATPSRRRTSGSRTTRPASTRTSRTRPATSSTAPCPPPPGAPTGARRPPATATPATATGGPAHT